MTQLESALKGIITPEMEIVAKKKIEIKNILEMRLLREES